MHTLIICRHGGFNICHSSALDSKPIFERACDHAETICVIWYDEEGEHVDAFASPNHFRHLTAA